MDHSLQYLLQTFTPPLMLLVAGVGGLLHYHRLPLAQRYLVGVVGWALLIEVVARVLGWYHRPNLFLIPLDMVGELTLLGLVYQSVLRSATFTRWLPAVLAVFATYALFTSWLGPSTIRFRPDLQVTEDCLLLLLVGRYFRKLLNELVVKHLEREPMFWVSTGVFMYCLGNIQIALFSNYLLQRYSHQLNVNVWAVHALLVLLLYSCYALALWMRPPK